MRRFEPIAIIGQGCILPGCTSADAVWKSVRDGRMHISEPPADSLRISREKVLPENGPGLVLTDRGGYISGFEALFDAGAYQVEQSLVNALDPLFQWTLFAAGQALESAGYRDASIRARTGVILGNLSFPTASFARLSEEYYMDMLFSGGRHRPDQIHPLNRFMSGMPALIVKRALGLGGDAFALDAACASGLYAVKLACDSLASGQTDLVLAGGVNSADTLFIHVGFSVLRAISPSGRSRPFHQAADGLIPAEGAAFVALKRLGDAVRDKDAIHGVIRGIGLSNDGRDGGFLLPSAEGQVRCMENAFRSADLAPRDISFIECHATGTPGGDGVEVKSLERVFAGCSAIALGSLKANMGHSITASGTAGLIKVLGCMRHDTIVGTPNAYPLLDELERSPFRVPAASEPWTIPRRRKAACVSSFGFGGNNAHLIIEAWDKAAGTRLPKSAGVKDPGGEEIAVVGLAVRTDKIVDTEAFAEFLATGEIPEKAPGDSVQLAKEELVFPPLDLGRCLGQQLLVLATATDALSRVRRFDAESSGVFIGMGADAETNRYGFKWRLADLLAKHGIEKDAVWVEAMAQAITQDLDAAAVIGTMPNIPANRINNQFDLSGMGFTLSCEELSGDKALHQAIAAIRSGALNSAVVGAVDLSREEVHQFAWEAVSNLAAPVAGADAAVVLVLKKYKDAVRDGDTVLGIVACAEEETASFRIANSAPASPLMERLGHAHAASGLLHIASALLFAAMRCTPKTPDKPACPLPGLNEPIAYMVRTHSFEGETASTKVRSTDIGLEPEFSVRKIPVVSAYCGTDRASLLKAITRDTQESGGPWRLAFFGYREERQALRKRAIELLQQDTVPEGWIDDAIVLRKTPVPGEIAFVYTGTASAYTGMGRDLLLAFPHLSGNLGEKLGSAVQKANTLYEAKIANGKDAFHQLCAVSFLCQLHTELSRTLLGIRPHAVLGMSAGETNALFAFDVWRDMGGLLQDIEQSGLYTRELGRQYRAVARFWGGNGGGVPAWENWRLLVPVEKVKQALKDEERVYLTIIYTDNDCIIGGDSRACAGLIAKVAKGKAVFLDHGLAIHCPAVRPFEKTWRRIHTRKSRRHPGVRVYSHFLGASYATTKYAVAQALTGQAIQTIDFPRLVNRAWDDGVRIFIEHGPRNSLSAAVDQILKDKPHLAVALDRQDTSPIRQAFRTACALWCAGVPLSLQRLGKGGVFASRDLHDRSSPVTFPLRRPKIAVPRANNEKEAYRTEVPRPRREAERVLERAPALAPVSDAIGSGKAAVRNRASCPGTPDVTASFATETTATRNRHPADTLQLVQEHHKQLVDLHKGYLNIQTETQTAAMALLGNVLKRRPPAACRAGQKMAVTPESPSPPQKAERYPGPSFDRRQLEILASGRISSIFGPLFEKQDDYAIQVRMPGPPLLLCDRVLGIAGDPGSMGVGTMWTQTDVRKDSWYLHHGRMPACIFIEAGQADLLLISWLGVDFLNQGKRAYRLLGCEFTYKGSLPEPGDTLEYEIHVDGHANQGDVRLFFFHYDCRIRGETRIMVRNGQAGFFTRQELQETGGAIWDPQTAPYRNDPILALPKQHTRKHRFSREDVLAYTRGEMTACFGEELVWTDTHTRTPRSQAGEQNLLGVISDFDVSGGPAGRGYLRMERAVSPEDWFFQAHFKNDPCMPGSLMAEACVQAMSFYMVGAGLTALKDGWRFEPVQNERNTFICRGQVTPESRLMAVEIFVDDVIAEPVPVLYAHVLFTVDGMKAFLCECVGLTLTPDWPYAGGPPMEHDAGRIASLDGFFFDDASVMNCALGRPSLAFGERMSGYDTGIRSPRLPAPPYLFISRIADLHAQPGRTQGHPWIVAEYDIPEDAWYFSANNAPSMPFCALMEIGLQPCGWLSTFALSDDLLGKEIFYRNLDGTAIMHREITPADRKIAVKTILDSSARTGDIIINTFDVRGTIEDDVVFTFRTVFGFFPPEAMQDQKGLSISREEQENVQRSGNRLWELRSQSGGLFSASVAGIPSPMLLMLDRITGYWPEGGKNGLGYIRAEKEVKAHDWFFKAHFFQDPVQPGSLGIEAMIQLIKCYMLLVPRLTGIQQPRFQPFDMGSTMQWQYRGQVTPDKKRIVVDLDILEDRVTDDGRHVCAEARLWIDGLKIYHMPRIGMRLVDAKNPDSTPMLHKKDGKIVENHCQ